MSNDRTMVEIYGQVPVPIEHAVYIPQKNRATKTTIMGWRIDVYLRKPVLKPTSLDVG